MILKGIVKVKYENNKGYVSARELHDNCKVEQKFADWIKKQLELVDAEDNDYIGVWVDKNDVPFKEFVKEDNINSMVRNGYHQDYIISLDIAKEICMVMGTAPRTNAETKVISKKVRKHFIECEKYIIETNQKEQFDIWRKQEAHETYDFYNIIGDKKKCIGLSKELYQIVCYKFNLDKLYKKESLYRMYRDKINELPWQLYLDIKSKAESYVETFMDMDEEHFMSNTINMLRNKFVDDLDNYRKYVREHEVEEELIVRRGFGRVFGERK